MKPTGVWILLFTCVSLMSAQNSAPKITAIRCGRLIDGKSDHVAEAVTILVVQLHVIAAIVVPGRSVKAVALK